MQSSTCREYPYRPLITLALLSYNQERFIEDAVSSVLCQTYENLEIILSDDLSNDGTYAIMQELVARYRGPHRVRVNRSPHNLGIGAHVESLFRQASGEIVVIAAGDDVSEPDRVSEIVRAFNEGSGIQCVASDLVTIETNQYIKLSPPSLDDLLQRRRYLIGASCAYRKEVITSFRPLIRGITYEDDTLVLRALLLNGGIRVIPRPLVRYRTSTGLSADTRIDVQGYRFPVLRAVNARLAMCRQWKIDLLDAHMRDEVRLFSQLRSMLLLQKYLLRKSRLSLRILCRFCRALSLREVAYNLLGIRVPRAMRMYQRIRHPTQCRAVRSG